MEFKLQDSQTGCKIYLADNGCGYRKLDSGNYLAFRSWTQDSVPHFEPIGSYKRFQQCLRRLKEYAVNNGI